MLCWGPTPALSCCRRPTASRCSGGWPPTWRWWRAGRSRCTSSTTSCRCPPGGSSSRTCPGPPVNGPRPVWVAPASGRMAMEMKVGAYPAIQQREKQGFCAFAFLPTIWNSLPLPSKPTLSFKQALSLLRKVSVWGLLHWAILDGCFQPHPQWFGQRLSIPRGKKPAIVRQIRNDHGNVRF